MKNLFKLIFYPFLLKREYIFKAINFEFTSHSSVFTIIVSNPDKNKAVLKNCLEVFNYTKEELNSMVLEIRNKINIQKDRVITGSNCQTRQGNRAWAIEVMTYQLQLIENKLR